MYLHSQNISKYREVYEARNKGIFKLLYLFVAGILLLVVLYVYRERAVKEIKIEGKKDLYVESFVFHPIYPRPLEIKDAGGDFDPNMIAGEAAIVVDAETGDVMYAKNADVKMPLASLVKIMTALVVIEHSSLSEYATISEGAANVGENSMGLSAGEAYTIEELLYGLMLNSGNDAAYALAENVGGTVDRFVEWMNRRVQELGLKDTKFYDPSGLDDRSYTTPRELAVLTEFAMRHEDFRKIVATVEKELPYSDMHKYIYLENQTNLLTTYPGVIGVKTGYTEEAGLCLSTYAENGGRKLVGVVLDSIDRKGDMIIMLDYAFNKYGIKVEHHLL
ncbi:MAG: hypothetical protein KatS3mg101_0597 [Patescibacteria group bacterium]|nr:MAG: hypothetical protein KatS3mg101_0597 [Patescibacteria group bacterium]